MLTGRTSPISRIAIRSTFFTLLIALFHGEFLGLAEGIYGRDITAMHIPYYALLAKAEGIGLMWNPYSHCGAPGLANVAYAMLYPPNLLAPYVAPETLVRIYTFFHLFAFAWGVHLLLFHLLDNKRLVLPGVVMALGSLMTRSLLEYGHLTILAFWAWLPWFFLLVQHLIDRMARDRSVRNLLRSCLPLPCIALGTGLQLLG
ncbi:MAG: hypothetical protein HQL31_11030, partial [Planctomycetes bacterium]|nr:hypothetical protein [Planctomycetota bacterium]